MNQHSSPETLSAAQRLANKAFDALERFLHIEAVSGIALLIAAAGALIWANSPGSASYDYFWHAPVSFGFDHYVISHSLHFWINDGLMTIFFLVVGMEVRREIHHGTLADLKQAALPVAAAVGGVMMPALLYLSINHTAGLHQGWAVPTATDIAFAVGVLALLGKKVPGSVRIFLLALAIMDDVIAVLIIAIFFSGGLDPSGFLIAGAGIFLVLGMQWIGIGPAYAYLIPGALLWYGLLKTGAHPTLAGVILGMMTPVVSSTHTQIENAGRAIRVFTERFHRGEVDPHHIAEPVKKLREAQRELLPPVLRVQMALHPWVAYVIMPVFALANAGVNLAGIDMAESGAWSVVVGIAMALVVGKPLGILLACWVLIRLKWCRFPDGITWSWMWLIGCLGGIGFTMSIFIANLAFAGSGLLNAAKSGVLLGSVVAGIAGLVLGSVLIWQKVAASRFDKI